MNEGKRVRVYFKNGSTEDGIVEEWGDYATLRSLYGENKFHILDVYDSVYAVREIVETQSISDVLAPDLELKTYEPDPSVRAMKLAELHKLRIEEEKRRANESLFNKTPNLQVVNYGIPRTLQKSIPKCPSIQGGGGDGRHQAKVPEPKNRPAINGRWTSTKRNK